MKKIFALLFVYIFALSLHAEPEKLITEVDQLWSDCGYDGQDSDKKQPISVLIDGNPDTYWHSNDSEDVSQEPYIDVIFPNGLKLNANERIVIKIQRRAEWNQHHPTAFEIKGSTDRTSVTTAPADWGEGFRYAYFVYRGPKTIEYSSPIPLPEEKTYYRLRFNLKANNAKSMVNGIRIMNLAEFQIYKMDKDSEYPDNMRDRFHLKTDIHFDYADYKLNRTGGILDPEVRKGINGLDNWIGTPAFDSEGKWTANPEFFEKYKGIVNKPDYTQVDSKTDSRITTDVKYQPAHVIEHELYAIPGDAVALYPFYRLYEQNQYHEKFTHWYDYQTGGNVVNSDGVRVLDFLVDPKGVAQSNDYGWFAGQGMYYSTSLDPIRYEINSVDEYIAFVKDHNNGKQKVIVTLNTDLDFHGNTVDPIGTESVPFWGYFDGKGHTIKNLNINLTNGTGVGMFGWISGGAHIQNLVIDSSCSFSGDKFLGVIGAYKNVNRGIKNKVDIINVVNHGSIEANSTDACAGGIFGSVRSGNTNNMLEITFSNCAFTGTVSTPNDLRENINSQMTGWMGNSTETAVVLKNCFATGTVSKTTGSPFTQNQGNLKLENCYSTYSNASSIPGLLAMTADEVNTSDFVAKLGENWNVGDTFPTTTLSSIQPNLNPDFSVSEPRVYGTTATFFYPRDVTQHQLQNFDKKDGYYIAADFCQDFSFQQYFDHDKKEITEPLINFRHIFHIMDGKKFADDNCSTKEKNEAYIRKNLRHITAEAGKYFQIRFNSPVPVENTTRSRLYYKVTADGTDYRRVCSMKLRVWKDGKLLKDENDSVNDASTTFYASETFNGYGSRNIDGINYNACGGGGSYYRMLACNAENAKEGTYKVQLIGLDYNGNIIRIPDDTNAELLIQELEITFLPKTAAVLIPEADLKKDEYRRTSNEWLTTNYGAPRDQINYDEYSLYNELDENDRKRYVMLEDNNTGRSIWPVPWKSSNYSFAYLEQHDYNMYQVVNHSNHTMYHGKPDSNMPADKNFGTGMNGLFDRKFYETEGKQRGFYYWVNAAADPGIMGYLRLEDFCPGSTVHVSGWISEFSGGERANLTINFVAVMDDTGERIPLHSHTTGYVPDDNTMGTWLYFYASFVPILTDKDFDASRPHHYEIELDNNCKNSGGADYAIDDIRVYLVKPVVYADQSEPICEMTTNTDIKISAPFDVLMQSLGQAAATESSKGKSLELYYSFVDYKAYNEAIAAGKTADDAFDMAVLRYNYRGGDKETHFGKITFNSHFDSNEPYHEAGDVLAGTAFRENVNGTNFIAFNTRPEDKDMVSGKEYLVALYMPMKDGEIDPEVGPTASHYQVGQIGSENDCSKSCIFRVMANHVIKVDGEVVNQNEIIESCRNQSPVVQVDLYGKTGDGGKAELAQENAFFDWFAGSMDEFTAIKNDETDLWSALNHFRELYPEAGDLSDPVKGDYTEADKAIIDRYSRIDPEGKDKPLLILRRNSYVFPPLLLEQGETERKAYVLAVPIPFKKENFKICTQPTEVRVTVRQRAPRLKHGIDDPAIKYPPAIDDVPLRISLKELRNASAPSASAASHTYPLEVPIYSVVPVTEGVNKLQRTGGGSPLFLAATDGDPDYGYLNFDEPVGEVTKLNAVKDHNDNHFQVIFYSDRMKFKEGYTYRFRFTFEEEATVGVSADDVCTGHDVFTIKVVPEYQKWTGKTNLNWNNDSNWRRIESSEIHGTKSDLTSDGDNSRTSSFAPLDFTKSIIPAGDTFPHLFKESTTRVITMYWADKPSENTEAGDATVLVQFDMAQWLKKDKSGVFCRPWYAHTCEQIHFEPRSQIFGQQFLHYGKAWVDMEVEPSIWLTASLPLADVVAGDMYLPSEGARQETEYFKDITFTPTLHNRFKPAVFQRSWDKAKAIVYKWEEHDNDTEDVKVETTWSNVYNDVTVPYSGGEGFSVRTDLTKLDGDKPAKVLFRLPKADTYYDYYTDGGATGDKTNIDRSRPGKLSFDENTADGTLQVKISAMSDQNRFFLVGNPFMAHLDMVEFFKANPGIKAKYWILTGSLQGAAVMTPEDAVISSTSEEGRYLAPLSGFFVEAGTAGKELSVTFTADMIAVPSFDPATRSTAPLEGLRISIAESGSTALVFTDSSARAEYDGSEDALFINDNSLGRTAGVFTRVGGHSMTVNVCPDIEGTEVGIVTDETASNTLRFDGIDEGAGLMLYDATEESYTPISDGMEVNINGPAKNRLFIVSDRMDAQVSSITINLAGRKVTVTSAEGGLSVKVYNTSGMIVDSYDTGGNRAEFTLAQGIYIVEAIDSEGKMTRKLLVR